MQFLHYTKQGLSERDCRLIVIQFLQQQHYTLAQQITLSTGISLLEPDSSTRPAIYFFILKHPSISLIDFFLSMNFYFANPFCVFSRNSYDQISTFLTIAVVKVNIELVQPLLQILTVIESINAVDCKGRTALHLLWIKPSKYREQNVV